MPPFYRRHYEAYFPAWRMSYICANFTDVCLGFNWQQMSIDSDDGCRTGILPCIIMAMNTLSLSLSLSYSIHSSPSTLFQAMACRWLFAAKQSPGPNLTYFNTLRPRQNGHHFSDDIFKWIFLNENVWISINFSLKFVPRGPINNIPSLVQIMAWRRPGDKPLSEAMVVRLPTHICVPRP